MPDIFKGAQTVKVYSHVPTALRDQVVAIAAPHGGTVSAVIRRQLMEYVVANVHLLPEELKPGLDGFPADLRAAAERVEVDAS